MCCIKANSNEGSSTAKRPKKPKLERVRVRRRDFSPSDSEEDASSSISDLEGDPDDIQEFILIDSDDENPPSVLPAFPRMIHTFQNFRRLPDIHSFHAAALHSRNPTSSSSSMPNLSRPFRMQVSSFGSILLDVENIVNHFMQGGGHFFDPLSFGSDEEGPGRHHQPGVRPPPAAEANQLPTEVISLLDEEEEEGAINGGRPKVVIDLTDDPETEKNGGLPLPSPGGDEEHIRKNAEELSEECYHLEAQADTDDVDDEHGQ